MMQKRYKLLIPLIVCGLWLLAVAGPVSDVNLSQGTAQYSIPLGGVYATAVHGVDITLNYRGNTKQAFKQSNIKMPTSWLGLGWTLGGAGYVTKTISGTLGNGPESYSISFDGVSVSQILKRGTKYYISGAPHNTIAFNDTVWTVKYVDGSRFVFGEAAQHAQMVRVGTVAQSRTYRWALSSYWDVTGNLEIQYAYDSTYFSLASITALSMGSNVVSKAVFSASAKADSEWSGTPQTGWYYERRKLDSIEVHASGNRRVAKYAFEYADTVVNSDSLPKRILRQVRIFNGNGKEKPGYTFGYPNGQANYYSLETITDPAGSKKTFVYTNLTLPNSTQMDSAFLVTSSVEPKVIMAGKLVYIKTSDSLLVYEHAGTAFRCILKYATTFTEMAGWPDYFILYDTANGSFFARAWDGVTWRGAAHDTAGTKCFVGSMRDYFVAAGHLYTLTDENTFSDKGAVGPNGAFRIIAMPDYIVFQDPAGASAYVWLYNRVAQTVTLSDSAEGSSGYYDGGDTTHFDPGNDPGDFEVTTYVEVIPSTDYYVIHKYNFAPLLIPCDGTEDGDCWDYQAATGDLFDFGQKINKFGDGFNWGQRGPDSHFLDTIYVRKRNAQGGFSADTGFSVLPAPFLVTMPINNDTLTRWAFPRPGEDVYITFDYTGEFCKMITPYYYAYGYEPVEIPSGPDCPWGNCSGSSWDCRCGRDSSGHAVFWPTANDPQIHTAIYPFNDKFITNYGEYHCEYTMASGKGAWAFDSLLELYGRKANFNLAENGETTIGDTIPPDSLLPAAYAGHMSEYKFFGYSKDARILVSMTRADTLSPYKFQFLTFDGEDYKSTTSYPVVTGVKIQPHMASDTALQFQISYTSGSPTPIQEYNIFSQTPCFQKATTTVVGRSGESGVDEFIALTDDSDFYASAPNLTVLADSIATMGAPSRQELIGSVGVSSDRLIQYQVSRPYQAWGGVSLVRVYNEKEIREGITTADRTYLYDLDNGMVSRTDTKVGDRWTIAKTLFAHDSLPDMGFSGTHQLTQVCRQMRYEDVNWNGNADNGEARSMDSLYWERAFTGAPYFVNTRTYRWANVYGSGTYPTKLDELYRTFHEYDTLGNVVQSVGIDKFIRDGSYWVQDSSAVPIQREAILYAFENSLPVAKITNAQREEFCVGTFDQGVYADEGWVNPDNAGSIRQGEFTFNTYYDSEADFFYGAEHVIAVYPGQTYKIDFEARVDRDGTLHSAPLYYQFYNPATQQALATGWTNIDTTKQRLRKTLTIPGSPGGTAISAILRFRGGDQNLTRVYLDNIVVRPTTSQIAVTAYDPALRKPVLSIDDNYVFSYVGLDSSGNAVALRDSAGGALKETDVTLHREDEGAPNEMQQASFRSPNFAPNWSFERALNGSNVPENWEGAFAGLATVVDTSTDPSAPMPRYGRHVLRAKQMTNVNDGAMIRFFNGEADSLKSWVYAPNSLEFWGLKGKTVTVSFWVNTPVARSFVIASEEGQQSGNLTVADTGWHNIYYTFSNLKSHREAPASAYAERIVFMVHPADLDSSHAFYLDGVLIQVGSKTLEPVVTYAFTDGLGKKIQTTVADSAEAIISETAYDIYGRATRALKPIPVANGQSHYGTYHPTVLDSAQSLYDGTTMPNAGGYPYSEYQYVQSDPLNRVSKEAAPGAAFSVDSGHCRTYEYLTTMDTNTVAPADSDATYFLTKTTDENQKSSTYTWTNALGQVIKNQAGTGAQASTSNYTYDFFGRETLIVDPLGLKTVMKYDALGRMSAKKLPDQNDTNQYRYDPYGRLRFSRSPNQIAADSTGHYEFLASYYDSLGRLTGIAKVIDKNEGLTYFSNGCAAIGDFPNDDDTAFGLVSRTWTTRYVYDSYWKMDSASRQLLENQYLETPFAHGRLVAKIAHIDGSTVSDGNVVIDAYSYDAYGRVVRHVKKLPNLAAKYENYAYGPSGLLDSTSFSDDIRIADGQNVSISQYYAYDDRGRLTSVLRGQSLGFAERIAAYEYNINNTVKRVLLGTSSTTGALQGMDYAYSIRDWLVQINHQGLDGQSDFYASPAPSEHMYGDAATYGDQFAEVLGREARGGIAVLVSSTAFDTGYAQYNGNVSWSIWSTARHSGTTAPQAVRGYLYSYDLQNRLRKAADAESLSTWAYLDSLGDDRSMVARYRKDGGIDFQSIRLGHAYNLGDATGGNYHYKSGRHQLDYVDQIADSIPGQDTVNYVYNANGNMICDKSKRMLITYDWRDMAVQYSFFDSGDIGDDGKPIVGAMANKEIAMIYDADGNRVAKTEAVEESEGISYLLFQKGNTQYRLSDAGDLYRAPGLVEESVDTAGPGSLTFATTSGKMWFDSVALNIKGSMRENTIAFPDLGLKISKGTEDLMEIDTAGELWLKGKGPSTTTYYYVDASGYELAVYDEFDKRQYTNLYGSGLLGREDVNGKQYFYLKDHLGSTRVVFTENESGTALDIVEGYDYYPYGLQIPVINTAGVKTRETFTGQELDEESGTYYFGARYYDPLVGVWATIDPMEQDWNPYSYAGGNPVSRVDIAGLYWETTYWGSPREGGNPVEITASRFYEWDQYDNDYSSVSATNKWINDDNEPPAVTEVTFEVTSVVTMDNYKIFTGISGDFQYAIRMEMEGNAVTKAELLSRKKGQKEFRRDEVAYKGEKLAMFDQGAPSNELSLFSSPIERYQALGYERAMELFEFQEKLGSGLTIGALTGMVGGPLAKKGAGLALKYGPIAFEAARRLGERANTIANVTYGKYQTGIQWTLDFLGGAYTPVPPPPSVPGQLGTIIWTADPRAQ